MVELVDGETRQVVVAVNDFTVVRTGGAHDLVVLNGVEPHLPWPLYVGCARAGRRAARVRGRRHASARPPTPSRTPACRRSSAAPPTPSWPAAWPCRRRRTRASPA